MGKSSKTKQNSTSEAGPWPYAEGLAKKFVDQLGELGGIGITGDQQKAFAELKARAAQGNPYAGRLQDAGYQAFGAGSQATNQASNAVGAANQSYGQAQQAFNAANKLQNMTGDFQRLAQTAEGQAPGAFNMANMAYGMARATGNPMDRSGYVTDAYSGLQDNLGGYARGDYVDPMKNEQIRAMLAQVGDDAAGRINAMFAGAGRDMSGANQQSVARGVTQAQLPLMLDQYNRQQSNQMNAASMLYGAGRDTSSTLSNLDQANAAQRATAAQIGATGAGIANTGVNMLNAGAGMRGMGADVLQGSVAARNTGTGMLGQGVNQATGAANLGTIAANLNKAGEGFGQSVLDARNYGANSILDLEQQIKAMPYEDMSLLASLLFPAAGLGAKETSSGTAKAKMGLFSDQQLKDDIKEVGKLADGQKVYAYHYKDDPEQTTHIGLMAQEVEKKAPESVGRSAGFRTVDYDAATKEAARIVAARRKKARA